MLTMCYKDCDVETSLFVYHCDLTQHGNKGLANYRHTYERKGYANIYSLYSFFSIHECEDANPTCTFEAHALTLLCILFM